MSRGRLPASSCAYCGRRTFPGNSLEAKANPKCISTRDHIVPQIMGSKALLPANVVVACKGCNEIKGHAPAEPFRYFVAQYHGTSKFTHAHFHRFIHDLTLAGFVAARAVAIAERRSA